MQASIGTVEELETDGRLLGRVGDREVAVFRIDGRLVAYENLCPHLGGPVCAGRVLPKVEAVVEGDTVIERFSEAETVLNCPWHGWEFDLASGECRAYPRRRLRALSVEIEGDHVLVEA